MSEILFDNGLTYVSEHDGELWFCGRLASRDDLDGLRSWFQAERDEQLGWWRASPGFVVKPRAGDNVIGSRSVNVLNELLGITKPVWEVEESRSEYGIAARAYFEAHPVPEPKSWLEAKPGEVWMLSLAGKPEPYLVNDDPRFVDGMGDAYDLDYHRITAGYRIYPAQDGDNDE
ncbi:hypothetical protein [Microbacterium sp.]|uniref:hypothetical protein n=1 Tax=Microbacterium sp. TaxID=51671 RepID=UPI002FE2FA77